MKYLEKIGYIVLAALLAFGCATPMMQPMKTTPAKLGPQTTTNSELKQLPLPRQRIVAAVYKFRDQTGQYKPSATGASWSTPVTQGATTILIKALEESKWFVPIERENMGNLLNERKIIRSSRAQFGTKDKQLLPPLLFAEIILEGGIISYETNVITGGAGLRYFGAGGNGKYREDRITIYLRAVSTTNGKILKTVYTTKSLLSQEISAGLFRYVKFKRLLEAETGFTYNEPTEMAVKGAIEKAVMSLIYEGVEERLWSFKDMNADSLPEAYTNYIRERDRLSSEDYWGNRVDEHYEKSFKVGLAIQNSKMTSDYGNSNNMITYLAHCGINLTKQISFGLNAGYGKYEFDNKDENIQTLASDINLYYAPLNQYKVSPFIGAGLGITTNTLSATNEEKAILTPYGNATLGVEYMVSKNISVNVYSSFKYLFKDGIDNIVSGKYKDSFLSFGIGVNFFLFNKKHNSNHKN